MKSFQKILISILMISGYYTTGYTMQNLINEPNVLSNEQINPYRIIQSDINKQITNIKQQIIETYNRNINEVNRSIPAKTLYDNLEKNIINSDTSNDIYDKLKIITTLPIQFDNNNLSFHSLFNKIRINYSKEGLQQIKNQLKDLYISAYYYITWFDINNKINNKMLPIIANIIQQANKTCDNDLKKSLAINQLVKSIQEINSMMLEIANNPNKNRIYNYNKLLKTIKEICSDFLLNSRCAVRLMSDSNANAVLGEIKVNINIEELKKLNNVADTLYNSAKNNLSYLRKHVGWYVIHQH